MLTLPLALILSMAHPQLVRSELIIQRTSGTDPDRFTENEGCTYETCSITYGAEHFVQNSCQCRCPQSRPTFSLQQMTCVRVIPDCEDLTMTSTTGTQDSKAFTVIVDHTFKLIPQLPVRDSYTGQQIINSLNCTEHIITAQYETSKGFEPLENIRVMTTTRPDTNNTFLQFIEVPSTNKTSISGQLLRINIQCKDDTSRTGCLPLKITGFQKIGRRPQPQLVTTTSPKAKLTPQIAYIVGGVILGLALLVFIIVTISILCCKSGEPNINMNIRRVERPTNVSSSQKHPLKRIIRGLSLADLRAKRTRRHQSETNVKHSSPTTTIDSGRGHSPSDTVAPGQLDTMAISDAILGYEAQQALSLKVGHQQPLFKSHQEMLSTASQGMSNVPVKSTSQHHRPKQAKKLSPFKRLFSRKSKTESEERDSKLSIDYDQFCITEASPQQMGQLGKRFSESTINPGVSFNDDGKLAGSEEVQLQLPTNYRLPAGDSKFTENELYDTESYNSSQLQKMRVAYEIDSELPVTCIDDLAEATSDFEVYEHIQIQPATSSVNDFLA